MRNAKWLPVIAWATAESTAGQTTEAEETKSDETKTAADNLYPGEKKEGEEETKSEEKKDETKTEDKSEDESKKEEAPQPLTVESLKVPEGVELSPELSGKFVEILNNAELSPADRANALLGLQADAMKAASEQSSALWESQQKQWQDEVRADPELGGEKLDENLASVRKLLDEQGSKELDDILDVTGAGNNIHMVRFLTKIAKSYAEGSPLSGRPASQARDAASVLYPNQGV